MVIRANLCILYINLPKFNRNENKYHMNRKLFRVQQHSRGSHYYSLGNSPMAVKIKTEFSHTTWIQNFRPGSTKT